MFGRLEKADREILATVRAAIGQSNSMHGGEATVDILIAAHADCSEAHQGYCGQLSEETREREIKNTPRLDN